jgi:hypothetical protein
MTMTIEFLEGLKYEWVTLKDESGVEYSIRAWTYLDTLSMHQEGEFWIVSHLILKRSLLLCPDAKTALRSIEAIAKNLLTLPETRDSSTTQISASL